MFVQTHFQRKSHQAAVLAQHVSQTNTNHKPPKCVSSSRSTKKVSQFNSKTHKLSETVSQDTGFERRAQVKNSNYERESLGKTYTPNSIATPILGSKDTGDKIRNPRTISGRQSREQHRSSAPQSLDLLSSSSYNLDCHPINGDDFSSNLVGEFGTESSLEQKMLLSNRFIRDTSGDYSQSVGRQQERLETNDSKISYPLLDNLAESLVLIGRSLASRVFTYEHINYEDKNRIDKLLILKLMKAHLELVVSFSVNLISYQLETWRLLFDDSETTPWAGHGTIAIGGSMCSETGLDGKLQDHALLMRTYSDKKRLNSQLIDQPTAPLAPVNSKTSSSSNVRDSTVFKFDQDSIRRHFNQHVYDLGFQAIQNPSINECLRIGSNNCLPPADPNELSEVNLQCSFAPSSDDGSMCQLFERYQPSGQSIAAAKSDVDLGFVGSEIRETDSSIEPMKSTRKLSLTGTKGRIWFSAKKSDRVDIRRSEEIFPETKNVTTSNCSADHKAIFATNLISTSQSSPKSGSTLDSRMNFVEGLGVGQIVSRHALVSSVAGEVQLYLTDTRGILEMAVIQARGLQIREFVKNLPTTHAKVYLIRDKKCIAKYKTKTVPRTADPFYHQKFIYREGHNNCIIQVIIWGESDKKSKKTLLGTAQIQLDNLDMSESVIGWYKLFDVSSMISPFYSSRSLRRRLLSIALGNSGN